MLFPAMLETLATMGLFIGTRITVILIDHRNCHTCLPLMNRELFFTTLAFWDMMDAAWHHDMRGQAILTSLQSDHDITHQTNTPSGVDRKVVSIRSGFLGLNAQNSCLTLEQKELDFFEAKIASEL